MKITKETAREKFRRTCGIKEIHSVQDEDPNYFYKKVDASAYEGLARIDRYLAWGWDVVYSKEKGKDDRTTAANQDGTEEDLRMSPVQFTTKGGHTLFLMRITHEQKAKNELKKKAVRDAQFASKQNLKKHGSRLDITGTEVDLNKLSED